MKIATRFEVINNRIQLFDKAGNKLSGKGTHWEGDFNCYNDSLTSLEGAPEMVGGSFNCSYNSLTSLEGAPEMVEGSFNCYNNSFHSFNTALLFLPSQTLILFIMVLVLLQHYLHL